jgi:8-oxo-dGTP diphosphatase
MNNPYPSHIIIGSLCYIFDNNRVLMLKRNRPPHVGLWSPPGGKIELGEAPVECCIRETFEETGLTITKPRLRAIKTTVDLAYPVYWTLFVFQANMAGGTLQQTLEGELRWIPLEEMGNYPRPYTDMRYWEHMLSNSAEIWEGKTVFNTPDVLVSEAVFNS